MFEIKGKVNTAICYAKVVESGAIDQIRRMCEALGYEVKDLLRVRVMNMTLDGIRDGQYRKLTDAELNELYDLIKDSSADPVEWTRKETANGTGSGNRSGNNSGNRRKHGR